MEIQIALFGKDMYTHFTTNHSELPNLECKTRQTCVEGLFNCLLAAFYTTQATQLSSCVHCSSSLKCTIMASESIQL